LCGHIRIEAQAVIIVEQAHPVSIAEIGVVRPKMCLSGFAATSLNVAK
jgi:hypothetical protein